MAALCNKCGGSDVTKRPTTFKTYYSCACGHRWTVNTMNKKIPPRHSHWVYLGGRGKDR